MKKLKIGLPFIALAMIMSCASQDLTEDTDPMIVKIEQEKGTQSNGNGGYQSYVCYQSSNGGTPPPCNNNGSGSGSGSGN